MNTLQLSAAFANTISDPALNPADAAEFAEQFAEFSEEIEAEIDRRAWHRTAQVLAEVGKCLTHHSAHSAAVAFALGLNDPAEGGMAQIGARLGVSKQAVAKYVVGLRGLFSCSLPARGKHAIRRPDLPGRWITRPELKTEFHLDGATADKLGVRSVTVQDLRFWDAESATELLGRQEIRAARRRLARSVGKIFPANMPDNNETKSP